MKIISTLIFLLSGLGVFGQEIVVTAMGIRRKPRETKCKFKSEIIKPSSSIISTFDPRAWSSISFPPKKDINQPLGGKSARLTVYNSENIDSNKNRPRIIFRCGRTTPEDITFAIVVDGVLVPAKTLNLLNPNDVESVTILKGGQAETLFGYEGRNGALVIATKKSKGRNFIIKNLADNSNISGASISLISIDKKDTIISVANDSGIVVSNKLQPGKEYDVVVSAKGFKSLKQHFTNPVLGKEKLFFLERVSVIPQVRIFPNPVLSRGIINIATPRAKGALIYRIFSPSGRLLRSGSLNPLKDFNQISLDSHWSSGVYLLQVYEKGCVLASGKVITQ